jgi:hypothetical protein
MAIQANTTVKGAVINNAYIKIVRTNIAGVPVPARAAAAATDKTPAVAAVPASTKWTGNVVVGVFANKALADASPGNAIDSVVKQIPNALVLPAAANVVASIYAWLLTLPEYAGAVSV